MVRAAQHPHNLADEAAPAGEAVAQAIARLLPIVQDALDDWTLAAMAARAGYETHHFRLAEASARVFVPVHANAALLGQNVCLVFDANRLSNSRNPLATRGSATPNFVA